MPILTEAKWGRLPFDDYRPRFFVETWRALLHRRTPHFYQARLMTVFSLLHELSSVIDAALDGEPNTRMLLTSATESLEAINSDDDFCQAASDDVPLLEAQLQRFGREHSNQRPSNKILRTTRQYIDVLLTYEETYLEQLFSCLHEVLTSDDWRTPSDETGKKRTLDRIYTLSNRILSTLLSFGYSSTYLYNRAELITHISRYKDRALPEQLSYMFERLKRFEATYTVIYPLHCRRSQFLNHKVVRDLELVTDPHEFSEDLDKLDIDTVNCNAYLKGQIAAPDYIAASWRMQNAIQKVRDLTVFEYKKEILEFAPQCLVIYDQEGPRHSHAVKVDTLESLVIRRSDVYTEDMSELLNKVASPSNRDPNSIDALDRVFRYYRLGITESTFESKLLAMWIALEALFENPDEATLDSILSLLPDLYAYDSLIKRLRFIKELLSRYGIKVPQDVREEISGSMYIDEEHPELHIIYETLVDKSRAERLYDSADNNDYVKFRIFQLYEEFSSRSQLKTRVQKTRADVHRQLHRIYYIRNQMVHRAQHGAFDIRLYGHLCEYLGCILSEVLTTLATAPTSVSLQEVLRGYEIGLAKTFSIWSAPDDLDFVDVCFVNPEHPDLATEYE